MPENKDYYYQRIKLASISKSKKKILDKLKITSKTEVLPINKCVDRILAEDVISKFNVPRYNNAAVDGFGFNHKSLMKNNILEVVGSSKPGNGYKGKIDEGKAIEVFTGSPILEDKNPWKVDTVIMNEDCTKINNKIKIAHKIPIGKNIRLSGEDIKKGEKIFKMGTKIRSVDLGFLASVGKKKLKVFKKIIVGVFSTGNELSTNSLKSKFQIYDSNKLTLLSLFEKIGCKTKDMGIIKDNYQDTYKKLLESSKLCDVIITTGGMAASKTDYVSEVVSKIGNLDVWKLSVKPGRPMAFGNIQKKPFFGLPGNPVAVIVTFFMLITEFIYRSNGRTVFPLRYNLIPSDFEFKKKTGRTEWLRGSLKKDNKTIKIVKYKSEGSGILSSISKSEGIIELDEEVEFVRKGTLLKFYKYEDFLN